MLKFILYVSEVSDHCGDRETFDILKTSRANNAKQSVTGMLVRKEKEFLQFIEGPAEVVDALFSKIEVDDRHRSVKLVEQRMTSDRVFYDWEMGFADEQNLRPLQWKWQLDKISLLSLADDTAHCFNFVKEFMGMPNLAGNGPLPE